MADRVDASVNAVQLSFSDSLLDRLPSQAGGHDLPSRDDSVLPLSKASKREIGSGVFFTHVEP